MEKFMRKWEELGINCLETDDLMNMPLDHFLAVVSSYEDPTGNKNNKEFMQLHRLLPDADAATRYWEENNTWK